MKLLTQAQLDFMREAVVSQMKETPGFAGKGLNGASCMRLFEHIEALQAKIKRLKEQRKRKAS